MEVGEGWDGPGNSNPVTGTRVTRNARAKTCRIPGDITRIELRQGNCDKGDVDGMDRLRRGVRGSVRRIRLVLEVTGARIRASAFVQ